MLNYDISRLKHKAQFGTVKSVQNAAGVNVPTFVEQFSVWCGEYAQTTTQQYDAVTASQQDNLTIAIRHNADVTNSLKVKYKDNLYTIVSVNGDDRLHAFDLIIIKKTTKAG